MIFRQNLTPVKSFECKKLSSFVREFPDQLYKSIEILIAKLAMSVNVKYNIEPEQAPDIAHAIYRKYYFYSIEEVALVLRMGSEGDLIMKDESDNLMKGKIYDRLSKDIILDWFKIYDQRHREPIVNNVRNKETEEYKQGQEDMLAVFGGEIGNRIKERLTREIAEEQAKEESFKSWREKYFGKKIDLEGKTIDIDYEEVKDGNKTD